MAHHEEFENPKGHTFTLKRVPVEWCKLVEPDTEFGKNQWEVTVRLENEKLRKHLQEAGFNVRNTKDKQNFKEGDEEYYFMVAYSKVDTKKGKNKAPKCFGPDGKTPVDGDTVGNGSICNVTCWSRYMEVGGKIRLPAYLNSVQVIELVERDTGMPDETDGDSGTGDDLPF